MKERRTIEEVRQEFLALPRERKSLELFDESYSLAAGSWREVWEVGVRRPWRNSIEAMRYFIGGERRELPEIWGVKEPGEDVNLRAKIGVMSEVSDAESVLHEETPVQKMERLQQELEALRAGEPISRRKFLKLAGLTTILGTLSVAAYLSSEQRGTSGEQPAGPSEADAAAFQTEPPVASGQPEVKEVAERSESRLINGLSGEELDRYKQDETNDEVLLEALNRWDQETVQAMGRLGEVLQQLREGTATAMTLEQMEEVQRVEERSKKMNGLWEYMKAEAGFREDQLDSAEARLYMAKVMHWWRLQYTEVPFPERMRRAGFNLSGAAFLPTEAEIQAPVEGELEPQAFEPQPVIPNKPDINIGVKLSHVQLINNNGRLAASGHTLDPVTAAYEATVRMQKKDGSWITITTPELPGITHDFDPTLGSYRVNPIGSDLKRNIVKIWAGRPPEDSIGPNTANGYVEVIDGDTGAVLKQRTMFYNGNNPLMEFFDLPLATQFEAANEVDVMATVFGPAVGGSPAEKSKTFRFNKQTLNVDLACPLVNDVGGAQFAKPVSYDTQTKIEKAAWTEWGRNVWLTEVYMEDIGTHKKGDKGSKIKLFEFEGDEFTFDEVPELKPRDVSFPTTIRLQTGEYMTAAPVDYINSQGQKKTRTKLEIRSAGGVLLQKKYMPQAENMNVMFASVVEINADMALLETNKGQNSLNMPADATLLIKDPQLGWKGSLLEVTATNVQTADSAQSFDRLYMGDLSWGVLINGLVYRFTYQQTGDVGQGSEVKIVIFDPDNSIYLPAIFKGVSMRVPVDHPQLQKYMEVVQANSDKWEFKKLEDGGIEVRGVG